MTTRIALLPLASTLHHRCGSAALSSTVLGESIVERQLRLLGSTGHACVVALLPEGAEPPTPPSTGPALRVARSGVEAAAALEGAERVTVLGHGVVLDPALLERLVTQESAIATRAPAEGWERIDGEEHWAGALVLDGAVTRAVLAGLGEWDAQATLLRRAVQDGVPRHAVPPDSIAHGFEDGGLERLLEGRSRLRLARDDGVTTPAVQPLLGRWARWLAGALLRPVLASDGVAGAVGFGALFAAARGQGGLAGLLLVLFVLAAGAALAVRRLTVRPTDGLAKALALGAALVPLVAAVAEASGKFLLPMAVWAGALAGVLSLLTPRGLPRSLRLDALAGLFALGAATAGPTVALAFVALAASSWRVWRPARRERLWRLWRGGRD